MSRGGAVGPETALRPEFGTEGRSHAGLTEGGGRALGRRRGCSELGGTRKVLRASGKVWQPPLETRPSSPAPTKVPAS